MFLKLLIHIKLNGIVVSSFKYEHSDRFGEHHLLIIPEEGKIIAWAIRKGETGNSSIWTKE